MHPATSSPRASPAPPSRPSPSFCPSRPRRRPPGSRYKPVTVIVPWAAGGATDQVPRLAASELEGGLGRRSSSSTSRAAPARSAPRRRWAPQGRLDVDRGRREAARHLPGARHDQQQGRRLPPVPPTDGPELVAVRSDAGVGTRSRSEFVTLPVARSIRWIPPPFSPDGTQTAQPATTGSPRGDVVLPGRRTFVNRGWSGASKPGQVAAIDGDGVTVGVGAIDASSVGFGVASVVGLGETSTTMLGWLSRPPKPTTPATSAAASAAETSNTSPRGRAAGGRVPAPGTRWTDIGVTSAYVLAGARAL